MNTIPKKGLKKLRIPATWCFAIGLLLCLNPAAWCNTADTTATRPHKAPVPLNSNLSGTVNGNQYQKSSTIESTQVIESGKTTYLAEEEVILNEGFEVKDGAEFEVMFDRDSFHIVTMLTYNLWGTHAKYEKHLEVIQNSKADVVSLQEVKGESNFSKLTKDSDYDGEMCKTMMKGSYKYGIGMLWNPNTVGKTIETDSKTIETPNDGSDPKRAYIVAEFRDFCFVATHYSLDSSHRIEMSESILNHTITKKCTTSGKPVYVAGDLNEGPNHENPQVAIPIFEANGFEILNDTISKDHITFPGQSAYIDLILEHNTNPYHKAISKGIPLNSTQKDQFVKDKTSDHFPYSVKLKVK